MAIDHPSTTFGLRLISEPRIICLQKQMSSAIIAESDSASTVGTGEGRMHACRHDVMGVFMHNWDEQEESGACTSAEDLTSAKGACAQLAIPLHEASFVSDYWHRCCTP